MKQLDGSNVPNELAELPRYAAPKLIAGLTGLSVATLERRRRAGEEPRCWGRLGDGPRAPIRYDVRGVLRWLESRVMSEADGEAEGRDAERARRPARPRRRGLAGTNRGGRKR